MSLLAITRPVSASLAQCQISFIERLPIDLSLARAQHAGYERALEALGVRLLRLPPADDLPDATFVEDTAIVLEELAVIPIMGAPSRRPEVVDVARCLAAYRTVHRLEPPATLDGGDVMQVERTLYVGVTVRTNRAAIDQLQAILEPSGYRVVPIVPTGCLHLKSACTYLGRNMVLANPAWFDVSGLEGVEVIPVAADEPFAANAVEVAGRLLYASDFPRTRAALEQRGFEVIPVDTAELRKAESAMTCMSIIFEERRG
jgi:dimethylargininase